MLREGRRGHFSVWGFAWNINDLECNQITAAVIGSSCDILIWVLDVDVWDGFLVNALVHRCSERN